MRMSIAFCVLAFIGIALGSKPGSNLVVCYFGSWSNGREGNGAFEISDINPKLCTHLIYAFVGLDEEGVVKILDPENDLADNGGNDGFRKFVGLRKLSPHTKYMVAMGGWNEGSVTYSNVVGDPTLRAKLVQSIVDFVLEYGFDGFDLDWEYPAQREGKEADVQNFVLLLEELRAVFDEHKLILSAAVAAAELSASKSYDIPAISKTLDFINLMTYDFHGTWDSVTGVNSPLYPGSWETSEIELQLNLDAAVKYWLDHGAPPGKLILGIGLYGKAFTLKNSTQHTINSPIIGAGNPGKYSQEAGVLFYYEICEHILYDSWTCAWDEEQRVPYAYLGDQWVGYDNVRSILEKAKFIKARRLGGAMIWSVDEDDFRGTCGMPNPILTTIHAVLREWYYIDDPSV